MLLPLPAALNPTVAQLRAFPTLYLSSTAAAEPPTLVAELRGSAGTIASNKLRHSGKTPGIIFSGPGGEQHLLAFESKSLARLVTKLGRTGWACSVFNLQIEHEGGSSQAVRALVRAKFILHHAPALSPALHCRTAARHSACAGWARHAASRIAA